MSRPLVFADASAAAAVADDPSSALAAALDGTPTMLVAIPAAIATPVRN
ncbi:MULTISPECIES: hypothetical protein [unclassified Nonomuraea]